ncbi:MAG TPA: hypothetical protein VHR66_10920 [Gemmataceae bacterium]|nr:hypothetical protein [Gemmataceae bacterium]
MDEDIQFARKLGGVAANEFYKVVELDLDKLLTGGMSDAYVWRVHNRGTRDSPYPLTSGFVLKIERLKEQTLVDTEACRHAMARERSSLAGRIVPDMPSFPTVSNPAKFTFDDDTFTANLYILAEGVPLREFFPNSGPQPIMPPAELAGVCQVLSQHLIRAFNPIPFMGSASEAPAPSSLSVRDLLTSCPGDLNPGRDTRRWRYLKQALNPLCRDEKQMVITISDHVLLNPLRLYECTDFDPNHQFVYRGLIHGDLHLGNVLTPELPTNGEMKKRREERTFWIIDWALASNAGLIGYDHAYLELSLWLTHLEKLGEIAFPLPRLLGVLGRADRVLSDERVFPQTFEVLGPDLSLAGCLEGVRRGMVDADWPPAFVDGKKKNRPKVPLLNQWNLVQVAAGLNWASKSRLDERSRTHAAVYAGWAATCFLKRGSTRGMWQHVLRDAHTDPTFHPVPRYETNAAGIMKSLQLVGRDRPYRVLPTLVAVSDATTLTATTLGPGKLSFAPAVWARPRDLAPSKVVAAARYAGDSPRLAVLWEDGTVTVGSPHDNLQPRVVANDLGSQLQGTVDLDWSPDGSRIAVADKSRITIFTVDSEGSDKKIPLPNHAAEERIDYDGSGHRVIRWLLGSEWSGWVAVAGNAKIVLISTGTLEGPIFLDAEGVYCLAPSGREAEFAAGSSHGMITLFAPGRPTDPSHNQHEMWSVGGKIHGLAIGRRRLASGNWLPEILAAKVELPGKIQVVRLWRWGAWGAHSDEFPDAMGQHYPTGIDLTPSDKPGEYLLATYGADALDEARIWLVGREGCRLAH